MMIQRSATYFRKLLRLHLDIETENKKTLDLKLFTPHPTWVSEFASSSQEFIYSNKMTGVFTHLKTFRYYVLYN